MGTHPSPDFPNRLRLRQLRRAALGRVLGLEARSRRQPGKVRRGEASSRAALVSRGMKMPLKELHSTQHSTSHLDAFSLFPSWTNVTRPTLSLPDVCVGAGLKRTGICSWATPDICSWAIPGNSTVSDQVEIERGNTCVEWSW